MLRPLFLLFVCAAGAVFVTRLSAAVGEDGSFRIPRIDVDVEAVVVDIGLHYRIVINPERLGKALGKIQLDVYFHFDSFFLSDSA